MPAALLCLVLTCAQAPVVTDGAIHKQKSIRIPAPGPGAFEYRREGVSFKPYVIALRTPSGINVVRDNIEDHPHHHGLMFAVKVDDVNFWEEIAESGTERSEQIRTRKNGIHESLAWLSSKDPTPLLREDRQVEQIPSNDPAATLISWTSALSLPPGATKAIALTGAHYHGLGMRFLQAMDGGTFMNSDSDPGVVFRGEERLMHGRWCAYTASVEGREVTVAMFDHPVNPRPATWFTMPRPFGYLSATLRLHETPIEVQPDKPVRLRYGVAVWDGRPDAKSINAVCQAWLSRAGK